MTLHCNLQGFYDSGGMEDGSLITHETTNTSWLAESDDDDDGMANFPTIDAHAPDTPTKLNGVVAVATDDESADTKDCRLKEPAVNTSREEAAAVNEAVGEDDENAEQQQREVGCDNAEAEESCPSSDADHLVIDEGTTPKRRRKLPHAEDDDDDERSTRQQYMHTNPYFAESIFELSNHYNTTPVAEGIPKLSLRKVGNRYAKRVRGKNGAPKLREYAQYLGLQPTVQFKCSKCGSAGFESLQLLNEHLVGCTAAAPARPPSSPQRSAGGGATTTKFKVTRKVFLCSACGTYYENWNLFLHMREVHKRFVCLYCLGMFPHAEKLATHLVHKHSCAPARRVDEMAFAGAHREPCFLMCCDCQMVFTEQDYVTRHKCMGDDKAAAAGNVGQDVQVTTNQLVIETSATKDGELTVELTTAGGEEHGGFSDKLGLSDEVRLASADGDEMEENDREEAVEDESNEEDEKMHVDDDFQSPEARADDDWERDQHENRKVPKVTLKLARMYPPDGEEGGAVHEDASESDVGEEEKAPEDATHEQAAEAHDPTPTTPPREALLQSSQESEVDVEGVASQEDVEVDVATPLDDQEVLSQEEQDLDVKEEVSTIPTAGADVAINEIELDQPLDRFDVKLLIRKCLRATIATCLYCNHARRIAVNGKQLGLHAIAEHRYSATVKSITAEELIPESFNNRMQESLEELSRVYFAVEERVGAAEDGEQRDRFECFPCRYATRVHKELYMHNRKHHSKSFLLCTMCKTSFYNYSELLCHLCPGAYTSSDVGGDVRFRCCVCATDDDGERDMPSAFRLMVHLRRAHDTCEVCLEKCRTQVDLFNHVWKHKLHHLCYRCGIAYRNKPDITKHLYWKHGTESVGCKRCLQKKWPHVYHFCQPRASFACDECGETTSTAVKLMVHKRLHTDDFPHLCPADGCAAKFVSKRLLAKHDRQAHQEPAPVVAEAEVVERVVAEDVAVEAEAPQEPATEPKEEERQPKPKVDVYDLPELNLSESSDSDSEDESTKSTTIFKPENDLSSSILVNSDLLLEAADGDLKLTDAQDLERLVDVDVGDNDDVNANDFAKLTPFVESPVMDEAVLDIWNNFKTYQENIARTSMPDGGRDDDEFPGILTDIGPQVTLEEALRDHDYCPRTTDTLIEQEAIPGLLQSPTKSVDHDYCDGPPARVLPPPVPRKATDPPRPMESSSDSDSSSCTCGSNCSCSSDSSTGSSSDSSESDSSSEEGRRRQQARREKRRGRKARAEQLPANVARANRLNENAQLSKDGDGQRQQPPEGGREPASKESPIRDSDLSTTESDTDEDFYDREPQKIANKLLAEKREKLLQLAQLGTCVNGVLVDSRPTTPSIPEDQAAPVDEEGRATRKSKKSKSKSKSKNKSKKKKKKKSAKQDERLVAPHGHHVTPLTIALSKSAPVAPLYSSPLNISNHIPTSANNAPVAHQAPVLADNENSATRASKRRRVPNKFYGYSSDEENEKVAATGAPNIKFRKVDLPSPKPQLVVPPITIKTTPVVNPISIKMSANPDEMRVQPLRLPFPKRRRGAARPRARKTTTPHQPNAPPAYPPARRSFARAPNAQQHRPLANDESASASDSNTSSSDDVDDEPAPTPRLHAPPSTKPNTTAALYCYCRCPYDEVSEMIGCDSDDCDIEWFHFECVGIMVPPKGQWFCPDCRKKKQQRLEALQAQIK